MNLEIKKLEFLNQRDIVKLKQLTNPKHSVMQNWLRCQEDPKSLTAIASIDEEYVGWSLLLKNAS